jgi:hypothetical protein
MTAEMIIMSCLYLIPGGDRCAFTLRYVCHLSKTSEMYARVGFIASPIELRSNLQAKMRGVNITNRIVCKAEELASKQW